METLTPDEQQMFLTQVNRLADRQLADLRLTPEDPPVSGWRKAWRQAADQAGLLGPCGDEAMPTLWSAGMEQASVQVIRTLARHDAGAHTHNRHARCHAFEGLEAQTLSVREGEDLGPVSPEQWLRLLMQEQLALLAIGAGVLERARQLALEYAGQRRQGGRLICQWPAVQQLLADLRATAEALEETLDRPRRIGIGELARLLRRRAVLGTDTSRACNQAMQVFGGIGYMRDLGLERLVREANALRVMSGSPLFLPLLAEYLEEE